MNVPWSTEQREWLQAMGYELLAPAGASVIDEAPAPAVVPTAMPVVDAPPARAATSRPPLSAATPDLTDPLLRALLRASRCDDLAELARLAGDLAALRRDPAAKRALWPVLRALRVRSRR